MKRGEWLRLLVAALLSAFLTGVGADLTLARGVVTRDELVGTLENYSPYVKDKTFIQNQLAELQGRQSVEEHTLEQVLVEIAKIQTQIGNLQAGRR